MRKNDDNFITFCNELRAYVEVQMMDLYFVLLTAADTFDRTEVHRLIRFFKLEKFASASMWVLKEAFGMDSRYMICVPNEDEGRFLLKEIMTAGNMGKYDHRILQSSSNSKLSFLAKWFAHNARLVLHYTEDALWTPIGLAYISMINIKNG